MLTRISAVLDEILNTDGSSVNNFSEYVKKLLARIEYDTPYIVNAILDLLELKSNETLRKNYIGPAIENGLIKMILPDKPNSKNQRYIKIYKANYC